LPPPSRAWERDPTAPADSTRVSFVGSRETIARQLQEFIARTRADELIAVSHIYDHQARLRSYELAAAAIELSSSRR
jgi:alkanesulfonate monooxygenase SsuD/methylene tetrahydromethanopterin reductase-like flavin-dependent oxidoreductase (luciferase family)